MDYSDLLEKYNLLVGEVNRLTEENSQLKAQLGLTKSETPQIINTSSIKSEINYRDDDSINNSFSDVNNTSDSFAKVRLFKLSEFLIINEKLPEELIATGKKRGRKKKRSVIGQLGGGKNTLSGIVDIAVMQSISRKGEVKEYVNNYGMVIADECHHASAFTYEQILKTARAKYIYGLTATPTRKDGHHPILFMHCGPIRYRDDPKKQAENRPFDHYIVPRFTSMRVPRIAMKRMCPFRNYMPTSWITTLGISRLLMMC
jgi:Type III restriction enzyme, res subunit